MLHDQTFLNLLYKVIMDAEGILLFLLTTYATMFIRTHFTAKQLEIAKAVATTVVSASKGISGALGINLDDLMKELIGKAKSYAKAHGLNYTDEQWEGLIREAYDALKQVENNLNTTKSSNPTA